jgi:hypothetical protein
VETPRFIRLSSGDNVIVAVDQIPAGTAAGGATALARIPRGHKMATAPIALNEPVRKYMISRAITALPKMLKTMKSCRRNCAKHFRAMSGQTGTLARAIISAC